MRHLPKPVSVHLKHVVEGAALEAVLAAAAERPPSNEDSPFRLAGPLLGGFRRSFVTCLVTDRRRLCPGAPSLEAARRCLVEQARWAVADGIDLIQIRERDLEAADLQALVADVVTLTRGSPTRVVVNDRVDVALAAGADGVHLRGDSVPVMAARTLLPAPLLVGRSVHTVEEAVAAAGADYLIAGTVFRSASKPAEVRLLGLDGLGAIVKATRIPVLAIGGITPDRLDDIVATGAAGIAAIGLFIDSLKPAS